MWRKFLKNNFSHYKWCRKYIGGYWELWYIGICNDIWFHIDFKEGYNNFRPGCGFGTPFCEYYPMNYFGYKTDLCWEEIEKHKRQLKLERLCK